MLKSRITHLLQLRYSNKGVAPMNKDLELYTPYRELAKVDYKQDCFYSLFILPFIQQNKAQDSTSN